MAKKILRLCEVLKLMPMHRNHAVLWSISLGSLIDVVIML